LGLPLLFCFGTGRTLTISTRSPDRSCEELRAPAELKLVFGSEAVLLAAGIEGRVTRVHVSAGDVLENGTPIASVGQTTVVAIESAEPFFRSLSDRAKGADVAELQCVLRALGFLEADAQCDGVFSARTGRAVRLFNESIGRGAAKDFDFTAVVWLPLDGPEFVVEELAMEPGEWFPAGGAPIVRAQRQVIGARIVASAAVLADASSYAGVIFNTGGEEAVQAKVNPDWTADLENIGQLRLTASEATETESDAAGLTIAGFLTAPIGRERVAVPTAALVETENATCVFVGDTDPFQPVAVRPLDSSLTGITFIESTLVGGEEVVVNPAALGQVEC